MTWLRNAATAMMAVDCVAYVYGITTAQPRREAMSEELKQWSKEWPQVDDKFYWMRDVEGRYRDRPVHVSGDKLLAIFDHSYFDRRNIEGQVEFIGPITPTDAERLVKLEQAARKAVNLMSYLHWESDPHGRKDKAEVYAELSAALQEKG
jgi:hypothetical protein